MNGFQLKEINSSELVKRQRAKSRPTRDVTLTATANNRTSCRLLRVLIVDDEPDAAAETAWHVHSWGYAVRASSNGHNALRIAAEQHPDVVLLNLDAPQLDWFATATQLRRDFSRSSCFIIAVTNRNNQSIAREYTTAEIDIVLQQPLDLAALETLLMLESLRLNRNFNTSYTKRFHAR